MVAGGRRLAKDQRQGAAGCVSSRNRVSSCVNGTRVLAPATLFLIDRQTNAIVFDRPSRQLKNFYT